MIVRGKMAEGVGFEPTRPFGLTVFKTAALDHSATPPGGWQGVKDLNLQPTVLETATLPIELTPCSLTPTPNTDMHKAYRR